MPTVEVGPCADLELQQIADALGKSKKVIVITGAGISTNCGIPDFRSENGLYSMIQAQYDAALQNPPWEESNTFDIDDRPKKKRRQWYYEVVAPDGKVVDVIDEELKSDNGETHQTTRLESKNKPSPRSSLTPGDSSKAADSLLDKLDGHFSSVQESTRRSSRRISAQSSSAKSRSASLTPEPSAHTVSQTRGSHQQLRSEESNPPQSPSRSMNPHSSSTTTIPSTEANELLPLAKPRRRSSRFLSRSTTPTNSSAGNQADTSVGEQPSVDETIPVDHSDLPLQEDLLRSSRSRSINSRTSRSSTPKSTESSLTSLSSTTPELHEASFQELSQLSTDIEKSDISQTFSEDPSTATQPSSIGSGGLSRTSSDISTRSLPNLKGRDLFDSRIWSNPFETSIFYMFISSLREKVQKVTATTETHKFISTLRDGGRLVRNYTQNIDMLEKREGLCQELGKGPGSKGRFRSRAQRETRESGFDGDIGNLGGCEVVPLHGSLERLRCNLCGEYSDWDRPDLLAATYAGTAPDCQRCTDNHSHRTSRGRRGLAIGRLRPDIVLYGEDHPQSNLISPIVTHDLNLGPDILLIMGTSLRVHGLKVMIREFAKAVHVKGGKVVFVNQTKPSESIWGEFIDYWIAWDCDEWVMDLKDRREDIWTGVTEEKCKEPGPEPKKWRPQALRDDKSNGVYFTFKILDSLGKAPDEKGETTTRLPYWSRPMPRVSDVSIPELKKVLPKKSQPTKKTSKLAQVSKKSSSKKPSIPKMKSEAELAAELVTMNVPQQVATIWAEMKKRNPLLSDVVPELKLPQNKIPPESSSHFNRSFFPFSATSNHIPTYGGPSWPNLLTHPPSGPPIPKFEPKTKIEPERPKPRHSYGTRAKGISATVGTIIVDVAEPVTETQGDTIVVAEGPSTPENERIKRSCSIGALVSSSPEEWHDATEVIMT